MAETRRCIFCERPLRRRWWHLIQPPPFCLDRTDTCRILWERRMGDRWTEHWRRE